MVILSVANVIRLSRKEFDGATSKLNVIGSRVARAVSGELLLNDKKSAEVVLFQQVKLNDLTEARLSSSRIDCKFSVLGNFLGSRAYPACWSEEAPGVYPVVYITIFRETEGHSVYYVLSTLGLSLLPLFILSVIAYYMLKRSLTVSLLNPVKLASEAISVSMPAFLRGDIVTLPKPPDIPVIELQKLFDGLWNTVIRLKESLAKRTAVEVSGRTSEAIARTTQALAHDVRKPFSMFKSIIQVIEGTEDPNEVRKVLQLTLPEVNQAMASVEGMIQDVMQIGSEATMNLEDAAPSTLIEAALGDLFRIFPEADVSLSYDFSHRHMVRADSLRVERVFANILGNAMQAMGERGNLWIRTLERDGFIEFTLGNGGSHIPHESLPKLFDAFFTSGKKGGTGLGLAIAKKIVEAHGGAIRCVSEVSDAFPQGMVEFVFTLPAATSICAPRLEALPRTSREIQSALAAVRIVASRQEGMGADPREAEIECVILQRIHQLSATRPQALTVLVVEDEGVYRNGLLSLLERSEDLSRHVRMVFAHNDKEALAAIEEHNPVLVIEDVDLGATSKDGIEIVTMLRANGFKGHICVHSNRFLAGDNRAALGAGADTVLPKPLGRAHFLKLLLASLPEIQAVGSASVGAQETPQKLSVAMIDDSVSMRLAWKVEIGKHTNFRSFASSGAFLDACDREEFFLSHLEVVVTDYNFAPGDPLDGGTLARELRRRGYQGLILRASGQANLGSEVEALFDADIGKSALAWPEFQATVAKVHESRNRI
jgi:signal transduction histidine kinase/DNA-binding NarL/FixJ family response regulator